MRICNRNDSTHPSLNNPPSTLPNYLQHTSRHSHLHWNGRFPSRIPHTDKYPPQRVSSYPSTRLLLLMATWPAAFPLSFFSRTARRQDHRIQPAPFGRKEIRPAVSEFGFEASGEHNLVEGGEATGEDQGNGESEFRFNPGERFSGGWIFYCRQG